MPPVAGADGWLVAAGAARDGELLSGVDDGSDGEVVGAEEGSEGDVAAGGDESEGVAEPNGGERCRRSSSTYRWLVGPVPPGMVSRLSGVDDGSDGEVVGGEQGGEGDVVAGGDEAEGVAGPDSVRAGTGRCLA